MTTDRRKVAGLDDAGRGAIIGPLVIGGVCVHTDRLDKILEIGVKDSKLLSPVERARMYDQICGVADGVAVHKVSPVEVDEVVLKGRKYRRLNYLEAVVMGRLASELEADMVYVDASDIDPERFGADVRSAATRSMEVISKHHADRIYPIVSAASIVAKVQRDREIEELTRMYGDFGSGYPADPRTIAYLEGWMKAHGDPPSFARRSWKTWKKIRSGRIDLY